MRKEPVKDRWKVSFEGFWENLKIVSPGESMLVAEIN